MTRAPPLSTVKHSFRYTRRGSILISTPALPTSIPALNKKKDTVPGLVQFKEHGAQGEFYRFENCGRGALTHGTIDGATFERLKTHLFFFWKKFIHEKLTITSSLANFCKVLQNLANITSDGIHYHFQRHLLKNSRVLG